MRIVAMLLVAFFSTAALADDCKNYDDDFEGELSQTTDARLLKAVEQARRAAHISKKYLVCDILKSAFPVVASTLNTGKDRIAIQAEHVLIVSHLVTEKLSDKALLATVAHEFAHLNRSLREHRQQANERDPDRRLKIEIEMDVTAAKWVGVDAVIESVVQVIDLEVGFIQSKIEEKLLDSDRGERIIASINDVRKARLEALRKLKK